MIGRIPLIKLSDEAMVPYRALVTPGTCLRMVLFRGPRPDWAKLLPTMSGVPDQPRIVSTSMLYSQVRNKINTKAGALYLQLAPFAPALE